MKITHFNIFDYDVTIHYTKPYYKHDAKMDESKHKWSDWSCFKAWVYTFRKYTFVKGIIIRVFGVYVNIREKNATEKIIRIAHEREESNHYI